MRKLYQRCEKIIDIIQGKDTFSRHSTESLWVALNDVECQAVDYVQTEDGGEETNDFTQRNLEYHLELLNEAIGDLHNIVRAIVEVKRF